jgi:predicted ATPase
MIEEANARSERTEECWPIAELLRVKGELLLLQGAPGAAAVAEDHFRQALDWARRQGALSWELPAAASLARLLRDQGRSADAVASSSRSTTGSPRASIRPTSKRHAQIDQAHRDQGRAGRHRRLQGRPADPLTRRLWQESRSGLSGLAGLR